jgi:hypothetical protein
MQWLGGLRPRPVTILTKKGRVRFVRQYATAAVTPADAAYAAAVLQHCASAVLVLVSFSVHFRRCDQHKATANSVNYRASSGVASHVKLPSHSVAVPWL